jgi:hypothetical protein
MTRQQQRQQQQQTAYGRYGMAGGGIALIALAVFAVSCGGGGGSDTSSGTQTQITQSSAKAAATEASSFIPVCSVGGKTASQAGSATLLRAVGLLQQRHETRLLGSASGGSKRALAASDKPADVLGDCGGRLSYGSDYSSSATRVSATLTFTDYCNPDSNTGNQEIVNGSLTMVQTLVPSGSSTTMKTFSADSAGGITTVVRDSGGATLTSETLAFTGLLYTVGNPGGTATAANPDTLTMTQMSETNNVSGKTRRQSDFSMVGYDTSSGGSQMTYRMRGYRSGGEYFDVTTSTPIVTDSAGNYTAGAITFSGSGGSTAVLTLVPGPTLQATMAVNGTVDGTLPACK